MLYVFFLSHTHSFIYPTDVGSDMPSYVDYKYGVEYLFISLLSNSRFRTQVSGLPFPSHTQDLQCLQWSFHIKHILGPFNCFFVEILAFVCTLEMALVAHLCEKRPTWV